MRRIPLTLQQANLTTELLNSSRFLDVRSPGEFLRAHLPNSTNIAILDDSQRHEIGTTYRHQGQQSAIELGLKLVSGEVKEERVRLWLREINRGAGCLLLCARGGLRSKIAQEWIAEAGAEVIRIEGGYKAVRTLLLSVLQHTPAALPLISLTGNTGVGKTDFLRSLNFPGIKVLDLEALANHRGSAFGSLGLQPFQASFENSLALTLSNLQVNAASLILVEAESRSIGRVWLSESLCEAMARSPRIELTAPRSERTFRIIDEYITGGLASFDLLDLEFQILELQNRFRDSLHRIERRLGRERMLEIDTLLSDSFRAHGSATDRETHQPWVEKLLEYYYDPMYEWNFKRNTSPIIFSGSYSEVYTFLQVLKPELHLDNVS